MNTKIVLLLEAVDKASGVINGALGNTQKKLEGFSKKAAAFGRSSMMGAVALGAPLGMAVNDAMNFEDKLGNIATIIDTNKESISEMGSALLDVSRRMPVALDDLTTSLYDIRSAGIDASQAMGTLEESSKLSVAGLSTVAESTDIMTSAMNAFKSEGLSSSKIADILFKTTAYGKTTIAQLSQAFGANASIVNAAGVKLSDFSAATAALTTGGVPASQAQNQLRAAVVSLIKPSAEMEKIFGRLGVSTGEELIQKFGTLGRAFEAVKGTSDDMGINLAKATGSVEALSAILSITGSTNDVYTKSLSDMADGANALDGAFEKQSQKSKSQMMLFKNNVKALSVSVGNILLPTITQLVGALSKAAKWLSDFAQRHPTLTKVIVIATAALAAFLAVMAVVSFAASAVAGGLAVLTAAFAVLTSPIGLVVVAITAVVAIVTALVLKWEKLVNWFKKLSPAVKALVLVLALPFAPLIMLAGLIKFVIDNWNKFPAAIKTGVYAVLGFFKDLWNTAVDTFQAIVDFVWDIPHQLYEAGVKMVTSITDGIKSVAMWPINAIGGITDRIREHLPYSPAKRGALRDIHRIKLVETISQNIKPGPMVKAMSAVTMATMLAVPAVMKAKAPMAGAAIQAPLPTSGARGAAPARSGGVGMTVNFSPNITVNGGGQNEGQKIMEELKKNIPELMKLLKGELERQNRRAY